MNPTDLEKIAQKLPLSESTRIRNALPPRPDMDQHYYKEEVYYVPKREPKARMNRLELAFYDVLLKRFQLAHITPQFRLRVSAWNAPVFCFYTADFLVSEQILVLNTARWVHTLYEVKDSRRRPHSDELTRPKMAREHNPWISAVILASWNGKQWTERQIA